MLHTWPTMISCPSLCPHVTFPSPLVSPDSSVGKESVCNAGDPGSIPGSGRYTREGIGYPLQYSWASLEAQLVKKPPGMQETWVGKIPWRRERLLTPVLWPGEFHGLYNPWGCQESDMTERLSLSLVSSLCLGHAGFLAAPQICPALSFCRTFTSATHWALSLPPRQPRRQLLTLCKSLCYCPPLGEVCPISKSTHPSLLVCAPATPFSTALITASYHSKDEVTCELTYHLAYGTLVP